MILSQSSFLVTLCGRAACTHVIKTAIYILVERIFKGTNLHEYRSELSHTLLGYCSALYRKRSSLPPSKYINADPRKCVTLQMGVTSPLFRRHGVRGNLGYVPTRPHNSRMGGTCTQVFDCEPAPNEVNRSIQADEERRSPDPT